jgi:general secretion pathway protein D
VFTTTPHTIPIGFVMNVTPQINGNDVVLLNVRPTISRIVGSVQDPNPSLVRSDGGQILSEIPAIAVRELESLLRLQDGQIAVMGGLMQDSIFQGTNRVPFLSKLPVLGEGVFSSRTNDTVKTELVVFIRPVIVRTPSVEDDLRDYRRFLERQTGADQ